MKRPKLFLVFAVCALLLSTVVRAQTGTPPETDAAAAQLAALDAAKEELQTNINIVWTCVTAFLVFFMQAGFAMVETGFTRAKNAVNILMKNLMDFCIGAPVFFFVGYGLMFGAAHKGWFGVDHFMLKGVVGGDWEFTFLIFQTVFAATAATIVSGAMAERTKFSAYLFYSFFISLFIYPIFGKWAWGGLLIPEGAGWLQNIRGGAFCDFAGSTVVHSIGGWLALAGAIILGPRIGKYGPNGTVKAIPGHNIPLAALGVFILWFGWFGFNPGSTTSGVGMIGRIAVTTNLAGAIGATVALLTAWVFTKTPDASMALNGALAGLVAITAPCATVTPLGAVAIGAVAGVLVVGSVLFIDRVLKIDDPVGAVSVHGVCGLWGTLSCGLFNAESILDGAEKSTGLLYGGGGNQMIIQVIGAAAAFAWAFGIGIVLFLVLKYTVGLRVSAAEEMRGLDIGEHGMEAYSGFQIFTAQ